MPYVTPPRPRLLLVSNSPAVGRVFRDAVSGWADADAATTILDCHSKMRQPPYYDAVAVDQALDLADRLDASETLWGNELLPNGQLSVTAGLLQWLHATRRTMGTLRLVSRYRGLPRLPEDGATETDFSFGETAGLEQRLRGVIQDKLRCVVQLVVPHALDWTDAAMKARESVEANCSFLQLEVLRDRGDTESLCEAARMSDADFDGAADKHLQLLQVAALLVITGDDPIGMIAVAGRNRTAGTIRLPARKVLENVAGYDRSALLLYLVVRAALIGGAGLSLHRSVSGCPADYCFDLLDLARGMTKGKICDSCKEALGRGLRDGTATLTPIQIADLEKLLTAAAQSCGCDEKAATPGGVPPPEQVAALPLAVCERVSTAPCMPAKAVMRSDLPRVAAVVKDHFSEYSQAERILADDCSFLLAARHYNSDSPTIPGARGFARRSNIDSPASYQGGGYFLAHNGFGIAIDPGYDFLRILYGIVPFPSDRAATSVTHGFTTEDIDLVIITHNHSDHLADLETILRSRRGRPLWVYCNEQVREEYQLDKRCGNTRLELVEWKDDWGEGPSEFVRLPQQIAQQFTIQRLPALHWQHTYSLSVGADQSEERLERHLSAFGLSIQLRRAPGEAPGQLDRLVITSDTLCPVLKADGNHGLIDKFSFEPYISPKHWSRLMMRHSDWTSGNRGRLAEAYERFVRTYSAIEADLACVHIGSLEKEGWDKAFEGNPTALRYDGHHLGLMGCYRLLRMMKKTPGLVLMSEFGEELVGFRTHISGALRKMFESLGGKAPNVLPTDIGLCVDLKEGRVRCTRCDGTHAFPKVRAMERGNDFLDYVPSEVAEDSRSTCHWRSLG